MCTVPVAILAQGRGPALCRRGPLCLGRSVDISRTKWPLSIELFCFAAHGGTCPLAASFATRAMSTRRQAPRMATGDCCEGLPWAFGHQRFERTLWTASCFLYWACTALGRASTVGHQGCFTWNLFGRRLRGPTLSPLRLRAGESVAQLQQLGAAWLSC